MIRIFKRRAWRKENGVWRPHGGARKVTVQMVQTEDEAVRICAEANKNRPTEGQAYYNYSWTEWERV